MSPRAPSICIVSTAHPSHNPRVVKEASALSEAGYRVRLATCQYSAEHARWDTESLRGRGFSMTAVARQDSRALALAGRLRRRLAEELASRVGLTPALAARVVLDVYPRLCALARAEPAELFIAHTPGALRPAALAARAHGARLAFDAEDLHSGELPETQHGSLPHRSVCALEAEYLPRCAHVTAASRPMAERLAQRYGIAMPVPVHNVFEFAERDRLDARRLDRVSGGLSIYWYSQVVGLDRGLQDLIRAVGLLRGPVQVHVRGGLADAVRTELLGLARAVGAAQQLHFHPKVPPGELLSRAAEHDVGAALEAPVSDNRRLTVTNKLFFYALAGLSLVATDTPGQGEIMQQMPDAGSLYTSGDAAQLAAHLQALIDSPERLAAQRRAALEHARTRFCWEQEKLRLVDRVRQTLGA